MYYFAGPTIGKFSSTCLVIYVECDFVFWRKILKRIEVLCLIDLTQLSGIPLSWAGCLHAFCCWCCWCCTGSFLSLLNSSWEQRGLRDWQQEQFVPSGEQEAAHLWNDFPDDGGAVEIGNNGDDKLSATLANLLILCSQEQSAEALDRCHGANFSPPNKGSVV